MMMPVDVNIGYFICDMNFYIYIHTHVYIYILHLLLKRMFQVNLVSKMICLFQVGRLQFDLINTAFRSCVSQ